MARGKKYTEQFPFVGTATTRALIDRVGELISVDKAPIVREGLDAIFGTVDGELRPGDTIEAAAQRVADRMQPKQDIAPYGSDETESVIV